MTWYSPYVSGANERDPTPKRREIIISKAPTIIISLLPSGASKLGYTRLYHVISHQTWCAMTWYSPYVSSKSVLKDSAGEARRSSGSSSST